MRFVPRIVSDAVVRVTEGRSGKWPLVRAGHLVKHPACEACGNSVKSKLNVHHIRPVHVAKESELDPKNLVTLCEAGGKLGMNCHLTVGHLGNWKAWNEHVLEDADLLNFRLDNRPMLEATK